MTDTERLNLIEHYGWKLTRVYGGYRVSANMISPATVDAVDMDLRKAIDMALDQQIKWALK